MSEGSYETQINKMRGEMKRRKKCKDVINAGRKGKGGRGLKM